MRILLLAILLSFFSFPAIAQKQETGALISGAYLLELCKRDESGEEIAPGAHIACQSYIAGLVDYHNLLRSLKVAPAVDLCVPPTTKLKDLQDIVFKYLETNAQHDAFIAAPAVMLALFEHYPCGNAKNKVKKIR